MSNKRGSWLLRGSIALGLAAILGAATADAAEKVTIGYTATLSGDFAAFGVNMRKGLDLALADVNGKDGISYEVVSADDRGDAKEGVLIAQKFCSDDSITVVMGYSFSSVALAAMPIYDGCGLPVLASAVTSPDLSGVSKYFRRNVLTDAVQGAMMGDYAVTKLGKKRIFLINQQDDYGIGVAKAFKEAAQKAGAEIVGEENYLLGTKDFKTQVTKIREVNPDAVFVGGFYTEAAKIADQGKDLGLNAQMLGTDGSLNPELIKLGGQGVDGMIVYGMFDPSVATPTTEKFLAAYRAKYNEDPNAWAALAYDATMTLAEAARLAAAKGPITRDSLNSAFSEVKDLAGITGPTSFDEQGNRTGALYFLQVKDGKFALTESK